MTQDELVQLHADAERWFNRVRRDDTLEPEIRRMLQDAVKVLKSYARRRIPTPLLPGWTPPPRRPRKKIRKPPTE